MASGFKYIGMSDKYKYVSKIEVAGKIKYRGTGVNGVNTRNFDTEKEAAIAVDKVLIEKGREPVNVLARK